MKKQNVLSDVKRERTCGTMPRHWRLVKRDPEYRRRQRQVELEINEYLRRYRAEGLRSGIVRIPVVVHVVYHTAAENISDEQINSQIDVLNEDFRRLNADAGLVPAAFAGVAADTRIEFQLAVRDPNCNATTGITRTSTSITAFYSNDAVKSAATGGHDPWPRDKYLNIWVCNLVDYLGYASFPGDSANVDGVVIRYTAFGRTGTVASPYDRGRTATHEIGHWLNMLHIWGDDGVACWGSDNVDDTPNQGGCHFGCPTFPQISCSNGPNGDMFMNYMDYVDDACMIMFSAGQAARMDATLHTARTGILASDGLVPAGAGAISDLWSKDNADDDGTEPDPSTLPMYISDDIWVRRQNDGVLNQEHQNPEYRPPGSMSNYVYVRVRNRACSGSGSASGTVKLYWAKASASLSWPAPWDGSVATPVLMGGFIGSQSVTVAGGDEELLVFPWWPPNPADYASFGADRAHFCLLSRIETATTSPYGMTTPEGSNLWANVKNSNNIVWKNITVVDELPGGGRMAVVVIANFTDQIMQASLVFIAPRQECIPIFQWGEVVVDLGESLYSLWKEGGRKGAGIKELEDRKILIKKSGASIDNLELEPQALYPVRLRFIPGEKQQPGVHVYALDVLHKDTCKETIGGQRFILKVQTDPKALFWDQASVHFDGVGWVAVTDLCACLCECLKKR